MKNIRMDESVKVELLSCQVVQTGLNSDWLLNLLNIDNFLLVIGAHIG